MKDYRKAFSDAVLRLEDVICLGLEADLFALSDGTEEFLENDSVQAFRDLGLNIAFTDDDPPSMAEELIELGYTGIFASFSQPMYDKPPGGRFPLVSWGYYTTKWFYGPDLESVIEQALSWAIKRQAEARAVR